MNIFLCSYELKREKWGKREVIYITILNWSLGIVTRPNQYERNKLVELGCLPLLFKHGLIDAVQYSTVISFNFTMMHFSDQK